MKIFETIVAKDTRYEVQLAAAVCGHDLSVVICGGTAHHVGAVVLASGILPEGGRPKYSPTVSSLSVLDHKDSILAGELSSFLAKELGCQVSLTLGIHIDEARAEEISILKENGKKACQWLLEQIKEKTGKEQ